MVRKMTMLLFMYAIIPVVFSGCETSSGDNNDSMYIADISYIESTGAIANPGRGWHYPFEVLVPKTTADVPAWHLTAIANNSNNYKIFQLRVNLVRFSAAGAEAYLAHHETQMTPIYGLEGTTDTELTQAALDYLEQYFIAARTHKVGLIVRFGYLWPWAEIPLHITVEPEDFNLILHHIEQLSDLINQYPDVILSIESGMIGQWGEQHSTQLALGWCGTCERCLMLYIYNCLDRDEGYQRSRQNFYHVIEKWLDCTRENLSDVTISIRYPPVFVWWYNLRYGTDYAAAHIHEMPVSLPGTDEYRIGVWNDSYLANVSDSGTYTAREGNYPNIREESLAWLERQARHTYFGGEYGWTDMDAHYHKIPYMEHEARLTHTTYLRGPVWMGGLLEYWRDNIYSGSDPVYHGKTSELQFIENRLGYRFVVRNSQLSSAPKAGGNLNLSGIIENVGFAPMLFSASASVLLISGETSLEFPVELDLNSDGLDIAVSREYNIVIALPATLDSGNYDVYLKFTSDKNGEPIALANIDMYDSTLKANKIGFVTVDGN